MVALSVVARRKNGRRCRLREQNAAFIAKSAGLINEMAQTWERIVDEQKGTKLTSVRFGCYSQRLAIQIRSNEETDTFTSGVDRAAPPLICAKTRTCLPSRACAYGRTHAQMDERARAVGQTYPTHARTHARTHTRTNARTQASKHARTQSCTPPQTHKHTHTHTCNYTPT